MTRKNIPLTTADQNSYLHKVNIYIYNGEAFVWVGFIQSLKWINSGAHRSLTAQ